ncbi:MAG: DUF6434 domain-containing protein [Bacteroidetes bacterium]|nr:DUF6434 domain-containing protein [Bacteroidota bacterium]
MENRPTLDRDISLADFNDFYWLKEELVDFCKRIGISTSGGKIEISDRIRHYILTGKTDRIEPAKSKAKSKFDWSKEKLTLKSEITDNYTNGENVRSFFMQEIGPHFSFNLIFMKWIKENFGKTLGDAIIEWKRINELKKDKDYISEIDPQFEYNRYMRAFLADNLELSSKDAMRHWKLKRSQRGTNQYERADLEMK